MIPPPLCPRWWCCHLWGLSRTRVEKANKQKTKEKRIAGLRKRRTVAEVDVGHRVSDFFQSVCVCVSQVEARLRKGYPRQDNMDVATDRYIASITRAIISLSKQSIAMISSFIGNQLFESHGAVPSIGQGL